MFDEDDVMNIFCVPLFNFSVQCILKIHVDA